jgi:hypothetical protein
VTLFNPGIGFEGGATEGQWLPTLRLLIGDQATGVKGVQCPLLLTSFDAEDQARDLRLLDSIVPNGLRWLIAPRPNAFASLKQGVSYRHDINHVIASNAALFSFRVDN